MSKADALGAGRFGGGVRPISARRQAVAAATGVPTAGVAPPTELPPHRISLNPDNPRSSLGDLTDLAGSLRTHGQKQAITVMNRDAYLKANPDRETDLEPDTTYVVIDGSSRLAAAREANLHVVKVMVSDDQGTNAEELLESALVANIHRQDLEELDEARALQRLLAIHGSQRALAKRLHRSQGWVSQRLALLNLAPELQSLIGTEPIDLLRAVGNKPQEQQQAALAELKAARMRTSAEAAATKPDRPAPEPKQHNESVAVPEEDDAAITGGAKPRELQQRREFQQEAPQQGETEPELGAAASASVPDGRREPMPSVPEQSAVDSATRNQQPKRFPYQDGAEAALHLIHKMPAEEFNKMLDLLIKHRDSQRAPSA